MGLLQAAVFVPAPAGLFLPPTAFCVYFIPFGDEQMKSHSGRPAISSNSVGVAILQPRVAGEARYPGYIYNKV